MEADLRSFGLTKSEVRVLFSIEAWLTRLDINATSDMNVADKKTKWLLRWEEPLFARSLFGLIGEAPPTDEKTAVERIESVIDMSKRALIFCETLVFAPYFNIQFREATNIQDEKDDETRVHHRELWRENVFRIAEKLDVSTKTLQAWESAYLEALKGIGGRSDLWKKVSLIALAAVAIGVTGGMAAPAIGSLVGGLMGLSGAAATSAGLAFLGGGAIAAGGFGIAGGTIALIGGGAVLGAGLGGFAASRVLYVQPKIILPQLAKLEASFAVIFRDSPSVSRQIAEGVERYIEILKGLKSELADPKLDDAERKNLEKTSAYFETAMDRLHNLKKSIAGL